MRRRVEDEDDGKAAFTQKSIEFGVTLLARLVAHQKKAGFRTFAEFVRAIAVEYLQRHGDAVAVVPSTRARFIEQVRALVDDKDVSAAEKIEKEFCLVFQEER